MISIFKKTRRSLLFGAGAFAVFFVKTSRGATILKLLSVEKQQFFAPGTTLPLAGGKLYTYVAGTRILKTTYKNSERTIRNANPILLDSTGTAPPIHWNEGAYKITLEDSKGNTVSSIDNYTGVVSSNSARATRITLADYTALRDYSGNQESVYITGNGNKSLSTSIAGRFDYDKNDTTSIDNGGTVIVANNGMRWKRIFDGAANMLWFGVIADNSTDNSKNLAAAQRSNVKTFILPPGKIRTAFFPSRPGCVYRGMEKTTISFFDTTSPVKAAFRSNCLYEDITFSSTVSNLNWQRTAIEEVNNVTLRNCGFFGFRHASPRPNAWGIHIARSSNIDIENCKFGDNSQSDIAITDNVRDVTIINATNPADGGVLLNIEPNQMDGIVGLKVSGGDFREIQLNENNYQSYASRAIEIKGAKVKKITYDGSGATFIDCTIGTITNSPDGNGDVYAGALMINTLSLEKNLLLDERFTNVGANDTNSYWAVYATCTAPYVQAIGDTGDRYIRTNPQNAAGVAALITRDFISTVPGEPLLLFNRARVDNTKINGMSHRNAVALWFNKAGERIGRTGIIGCRTAKATRSAWCEDVAILIVPIGATQCKVQFGASETQHVSSDQSAAGLFRFKFQKNVGNMQAVLRALTSSTTSSMR